MKWRQLVDRKRSSKMPQIYLFFSTVRKSWMRLVNNSFLPDDVDSFEILVLRRKRREIKYPFWMGFETCVLVNQRCKTLAILLLETQFWTDVKASGHIGVYQVSAFANGGIKKKQIKCASAKTTLRSRRQNKSNWERMRCWSALAVPSGRVARVKTRG